MLTCNVLAVIPRVTDAAAAALSRVHPATAGAATLKLSGMAELQKCRVGHVLAGGRAAIPAAVRGIGCAQAATEMGWLPVRDAAAPGRRVAWHVVDGG